MSAILKKGQSGIPPAFLPRPLLPRPSEHRIEAPRTARILGGQNPERKTPFPFLKDISPPPSQKCKECFFFRGCWRTRQCVGLSPSVRFLVRATTRSARAISRGCFQNKFEFCTIDTAKIQNPNSRKKYGRAEGATLGLNPRRIQNPKGFSTLRVAPRLPIQNKKW